jgi:hypothetical protein
VLFLSSPSSPLFLFAIIIGSLQFGCYYFCPTYQSVEIWFFFRIHNSNTYPHVCTVGSWSDAVTKNVYGRDLLSWGNSNVIVINDNITS